MLTSCSLPGSMGETLSEKKKCGAWPSPGKPLYMTFRVALVADSECQSDTMPSPRNSATWRYSIAVGRLVVMEVLVAVEALVAVGVLPALLADAAAAPLGVAEAGVRVDVLGPVGRFASVS